MNAVTEEAAAAEPAAVRPADIKPGNLPDAIIPIVPTRPDGSPDVRRQGWRAIAVTSRRCIAFKRRLQQTELVGTWLHPADPVGLVLQHGVPPTVASLNRLIAMIGRLAVPDEYQDEVRSLGRADGEERTLPATEADCEPAQARQTVLALNRSSGQFRNRLRRLHQFVEPLAATDRLDLRPVILAMNLVIDHVELLMEMHAGLPRVVSSRFAYPPPGTGDQDTGRGT
jgi:hypothetical protein